MVPELEPESESRPAKPSVRKKLKKKNKTKRWSQRAAAEFDTFRASWTDEEKEVMVDCLANFGPTRINSIKRMLPDKNVSQIRNFLYNRARATYLLSREYRIRQFDKLNLNSKNHQTCLAIPILQEQKVFRGPKTAISNALLLISELEEQPEPEDNSSIDFKCLYKTLYMASKGYPLPDMNAATQKFLLDSMEALLITASGNPLSHFAVAPDESSNMQQVLECSSTNPLGFSHYDLRARVNLDFQSSKPNRIFMAHWMDPRDSMLI